MLIFWLLLAVGLALLISGADLLVRGAARLAVDFGVPTLVIGLTVVAFGTSAPELAVSVKSAWSGQTELAIANVVGSNIFNILCVLGISGIISPEALQAGVQLQSLDIPVMLAAAVLCLPLFITGASLNRLEGLVFLALYGVYLGYLITFTVAPAYLPTLQSITLYGVAPFTVIFVASTLIYDMRQKTISSR